MQKICIQRFNDNIVHGIRHCIIPSDCGINESQKNDIIIHEDDIIIVINQMEWRFILQKKHKNIIIIH